MKQLTVKSQPELDELVAHLDKSTGYPKDVVLHNWYGPLPQMRFEHYDAGGKHPKQDKYALPLATTKEEACFATTAGKAVTDKVKPTKEERTDDWAAVEAVQAEPVKEAEKKG